MPVASTCKYTSSPTAASALPGCSKIAKESPLTTRWKVISFLVPYLSETAQMYFQSRSRGPAILVFVTAFFDKVIEGMKDAAREYAVYGMQVDIRTMKG